MDETPIDQRESGAHASPARVQPRFAIEFQFLIRLACVFLGLDEALHVGLLALAQVY